MNLIYVAVTRAMKILAINSLVLSIMQRYVDDRQLKEQIAICKNDSKNDIGHSECLILT